jgi:Polyketide cyclase / dehydrase and lipid transport
MPKLTDSLVIDAPLQVVWETSTEPEAWMDISDVTVERLTGPGFDVGTRWRETRKMLGRDSAQEWEVTLLDEPTRYTCVSQGMGADWVFHQFLLPDGRGTRLFYEFTMTPTSSRSRVAIGAIWPVLGAMMRRGVAKEYASFAVLCRNRARLSGAAAS